MKKPNTFRLMIIAAAIACTCFVLGAPTNQQLDKEFYKFAEYSVR